MKKMNFIRTTDAETKDKLLSEGFELINSKDGIYVFLNDRTIKFDQTIDKTKFNYSNMFFI